MYPFTDSSNDSQKDNTYFMTVQIYVNMLPCGNVSVVVSIVNVCSDHHSYTVMMMKIVYAHVVPSDVLLYACVCVCVCSCVHPLRISFEYTGNLDDMSCTEHRVS